MSILSFHNLVNSGQLEVTELSLPGYCTPAAIDCCFEHAELPLEVYSASYKAFKAGEIESPGQLTDYFYGLLDGFFGVDRADRNCEFRDPNELYSALQELRAGRMTITLDANNGEHSVGLRPIASTEDRWAIVGTHSLIRVRDLGGADDGLPQVSSQGIMPLKELSPEDIWNYLVANNKSVYPYTGCIFPPEPAC